MKQLDLNRLSSSAARALRRISFEQNSLLRNIDEMTNCVGGRGWGGAPHTAVNHHSLRLDDDMNRMSSLRGRK